MVRKKISIIGTGRVGSTTGFWCFVKEYGDIVLWNIKGKIAKGIALDITESAPLVDSDVSITGTQDYKKTADSDVIVITAGAQRKAGMTRDDLLSTNLDIVRSLVKNTVRMLKRNLFARHPKNSVDFHRVLTFIVWKHKCQP